MNSTPSLDSLNDLLAGVDHARSILPMPALMRMLGLGDFIDIHAKCGCPFCWSADAFAIHEDSDGTWRFDCDKCGGGDEVALLQKHLDNGVTWPEAAWHYAELVSTAGAPTEIRKPAREAAGARPNDTGVSEINQRSAESIPSEGTELGKLLEAICHFLCRYVAFQCREQPIVVALWIVHTWTIKAFDYTPYLFVHSAEKRSGKTRLLDVLESLVNTPWRAGGASEAVLFRKVDRDKPTLLYDEVDTVFSNRNNGVEDVRRLLNVAFERGAKMARCVGEGNNFDIKEFDPFCPKVLSGIGKVLPDTVTDRCLSIELQRQLREQKAAKFRKRDVEPVVAPIRAELKALSEQAELIETLRDARPALPEQLSDRQQDICEPLLAIADMAGGDWSQNARAALIKLCTQEEDVSNGIKLLSDIRSIFDSNYTDRLTTQEILEELIQIEDSPWAGWWADDLKHDQIAKAASRLARMLRGYKTLTGERLRAHTIRTGLGTPRGFYRNDFEDAWKRYLPPPSEKAAAVATTATAQNEKRNEVNQQWE